MSVNFIKQDLAQAKADGLSAHKQSLLCEIEILKGKLQPHDTGHIHTAINVLTERCTELDKEIYSIE